MSRLSGEELNNLKKMASDICDQSGCLLYDIEFLGVADQRVLRVYVDRPNGEVTLDDCANVSRGLNLLLDVNDVIPGDRYNLEVSSPGIERKLKELWHFDKAIGQTVRITTSEPIPLPEGIENKSGRGPTAIDGILLEATDSNLKVKNDKATWNIPKEHVRKANVKFVMNDSQSNKKKKR